MELIDRILPILPPRISQHSNYVRSGAFYPDAFYNCQGQYDVAEDAHWPPFLAKGAEIVRNRRARGIDTSKFEAFLVGIMSHQVSDVSWHSLGLFEGLLRAMADIEFDGDYDAAHSVLDVGGDMILLGHYVDTTEKSTAWEYDIEDITELLIANGYPGIFPSSIHFCMARGQAAYTAELRVAPVAFKRYARRSPFIFDNLESYETGGLTDMHEQIQECLPSLFTWMNSTQVSDESINPWDLCQVFSGCKQPHVCSENEDFRKRSISWQDTLHSAGHYVSDVEEIIKDSLPEINKKIRPKLLESESDQVGHIITSPNLQFSEGFIEGQTTNNKAMRTLFGYATSFWGSRVVVSAIEEGTVYLLDENFNYVGRINDTKTDLKPLGGWASRFGAQVKIWDSYLAVSSPGDSRIDVYDDDLNWVGGIKWTGITTTYGAKGFKMVGEQLVVDEDDKTLYVGAPHSDYHGGKHEDWIDQAGCVYALPQYVLESLINKPRYITLGIDDFLLHHGTQKYDRVGASLAVTPRFILVGVPGRSEVHGFDFATNKQILTLKGKDKPEKSGYGAYAITGNRDHLVIGSPIRGSNEEGGILIYKNNQARSIKIDEEFGWFGEHGIIVKNDLYVVSSHAESGNGKLWKIDLTTGELTSKQPGASTFNSRLGTDMTSNGTHLIIGMPYYHSRLEGVEVHGGVLLVELKTL